MSITLYSLSSVSSEVRLVHPNNTFGVSHQYHIYKCPEKTHLETEKTANNSFLS